MVGAVLGAAYGVPDKYRAMLHADVLKEIEG